MKILMISAQPRNTGIRAYSYYLFEYMKKIIDKDIDFKSICDKDSYAITNRIITYLSIYNISKDYELFHFTDPMMTFAVKRYKPSVVTIHDLAPYFYDGNIFFMKMNMKFLNDTDKIICISEHTKKDLLNNVAINEKDVRIVYNGVDHSIFTHRNMIESRKKLCLPLDKKIILNVGTEIKRKNVSILIKIMRLLKDNNILLLRIGKRTQEINSLIKSLGLENRILYFTPSSDDLPYFYNSADIFVSTAYYEGFGLPILEALASGCPVIAGNNSSIPEIVGDSGILLDTSDIESYSEKIEYLLSNDNYRYDIAKKGYERSKLFSWNRCANETFEIYKEIIEGK